MATATEQYYLDRNNVDKDLTELEVVAEDMASGKVAGERTLDQSSMSVIKKVVREHRSKIKDPNREWTVEDVRKMIRTRNISEKGKKHIAGCHTFSKSCFPRVDPIHCYYYVDGKEVNALVYYARSIEDYLTC